MAPAPEPPEEDAPRAPDDAAPDETLDEPQAPPRRARAASDASDAGEPKRQRVDAPAPAPDESDASEASDESGSKRHDESDGEAAPPPPDKRRDRYEGHVYDPYGPESLPNIMGDALAEESTRNGWGYSELSLRHLAQPSAHALTGPCCALVLEAFFALLGDDGYSRLDIVP